MSESRRPLDPNDPIFFAPPRLRESHLASTGSETDPQTAWTPVRPADPRSNSPPVAGRQRHDAFAEAMARAARAQLEAERAKPSLGLQKRPTVDLALSLSIVVAITFLAALVYVVLLSPSQDLSSDRFGLTQAAPQLTQSTRPDEFQRSMPRLVVSNQSGPMNEPLQLGVHIDEPIPAGIILIKGLPPDTSLTVGARIRRSEWSMRAEKIAETKVIPPIDFVGDLPLSAELHQANGAVLVTNTWHLTWGPAARRAETVVADAMAKMAVEPSPMIRQREADQQQLAMTSPTAAKDENQKSGGVPVPATAIAPLRRDGSAVAPNETIGATTSAVARLDPIDEPDLAQLVRRGTNLMAIGDVSAARLMFQQAAEAGSAGAAFALAETYDPAASKRQTSSLDIALARNWYEKARVLGAPTAEERLARLTQPQR